MRNRDLSRFRLQTFEGDWIERATSGDMPVLEAVLAEENRRWIVLGQQVGYFASDDKAASQPIGEAPQWVFEAVAEISAASEEIEDEAEFVEALIEAQMDLTPGRRAYLDLLMFANDQTWASAMTSFEHYLAQLETAARGEALPIPPEDLGWAMSGAESNLDYDPRFPANWRSEGCGERLAPPGRSEALTGARERLLDIVLNAEPSLSVVAGKRARPLAAAQRLFPLAPAAPPSRHQATRAKSSPRSTIDSLQELRIAYKRYFSNPRPEHWATCAACFASTVELLENPQVTFVIDKFISSAVADGATSSPVAASLAESVAQGKAPLERHLGTELGYRNTDMDKLFRLAISRLASARARHVALDVPLSTEDLVGRLHDMHDQVRLVYYARGEYSRRDRRRIRGEVRLKTERELFAVGILAATAVSEQTSVSHAAVALSLGVTGAQPSKDTRLTREIAALAEGA